MLMKRILLAILVCSLLVLVACASSSVSEDKSGDATDEDFNQYIGYALATLGDLPE